MTFPVQAEPLKIASWNMQWLSNTLNKGQMKRNQNDYQVIAKYAAQLDADIIAVQEVQGKKALKRVFDEQQYNFVVSERRGAQRVGFVIRKGISYRRHKDLRALKTTQGLRHGVDITVKSKDSANTLRLLAVHLKSGWFKGNYDTSSRDVCQKLKNQIPVLEAWIDQRADDHQPMLILGDFNRRMKTHEKLWQEIDDSEPVNADLMLHTQGIIAECYNRKYPAFIDHLITGRLSTRFVVNNSFRQYLYSARDRVDFATLPDHCPISLSLNL